MALRVSVIVCAHNEAVPLPACLQSLLAQTRLPDEIARTRRVGTLTERAREEVAMIELQTTNAEQVPVGFAEALRRAQAEFLEMPGLRLTEAQAARL